MILAITGVACSPSPAFVEPPGPGPGVIFSYPESGQVDVPVGTRVTVTLSDPVQGSPTQSCTVTAAGTNTGGICLVGPSGPVASTLQIAGPNGNVIQLQPTADLLPGQTYSMFVPPSVLGGQGVNLPSSGALFQFTTRQDNPQPGMPATVISINDESPADYASSSAGPTTPFVTFMSVRAVFSEPVDPNSFVLGKTLRFVQVGPGGVLTDVPGQLWVQDIHLTFDPTADLQPGATYQLMLLAGLVDEGGEALAVPATWSFQPQAASADGGTFPQTLAVTPPGTTSGPEGTLSSLSGVAANSIELRSPLIGQPVLAALAGGIESELADPSAFGGPIPLTIRAGQRLDLSPLAVQFGGVLDTPYTSGSMHMLFLTDANGVIRRNAYHPASTNPDDQRSPVSVDFTFDTLLFSDDPMGNVLSTQTLFGVHMTGTSVTSGTSLAIDTIGALEFSALGTAKATGDASFRLLSQPGAPLTAGMISAPTLTATSPTGGQLDFPTSSHLLLFTSVPVDLASAIASNAVTLVDSQNIPVPFALDQDGAALVLIPSAPLALDSSYTLTVSGLVDALQTPFAPASATIAFQTEAAVQVTSTAPFLAALLPGAPCALTGGGPTDPGHCAGGLASDVPYQPFTASGTQHIVARFSQPMQASSMVLGTACGQGSVRVEEVNNQGTCTGVVPGILTYVERGFDFVPAAPWVVDQTYQLTLDSGQDSACATGGICSVFGRSLNATPLAGIADTLLTTQGGGTNVVIPFSGIEAQPVTYLTMGTTPFADLNGDGAVDGPETIADGNRLSVSLTGTGGFIESSSQLLGTACDAASPAGSVCQSLEQFLPIKVQPAIPSCPVDVNGNATDGGPPCVPSRLSPQLITLTGMAMNVDTNLLFGSGISLSDVPTGMLLMRLLEPGPGGIVGYMIDDPTSGQTQFVVITQVYIDAPDLVLAGGLATHNLHSYPSQVTLKGPVTFLPDGRFQVASVNLADVELNVVSSALASTGTMTLDVPAGALHLTLAGEPIK